MKKLHSLLLAAAAVTLTGCSTTNMSSMQPAPMVEMENGFKVWHMGYTGVLGEMRLIGEMYRPDAACPAAAESCRSGSGLRTSA